MNALNRGGITQRCVAWNYEGGKCGRAYSGEADPGGEIVSGTRPCIDKLSPQVSETQVVRKAGAKDMRFRQQHALHANCRQIGVRV